MVIKMINDNLLIFIISIVLIYVFDHKIIPTLGVVVLSIIQIYIILVIDVATITEYGALYLFLYIVSMIYGAYMIFFAPIEAEEMKSQDVML